VETTGGSGLRIRLLGSFSVERDGLPVALPRSRKVRGLFGFLALTPGAVGRSRLCDLLWDVPNDPRGELRWCLSKLRSVLGPDGQCLATPAPDQVALDVSGCFVDAVAVDRALHAGVGEVESARLAEICGWFGGELLAGLHLDGSAAFQGWLTAQRQRYHALHGTVLEELVRRSPRGSQETFERLDAWLQLAPFDLRPHEFMLDALVQRGRLSDAQDHLANAVRLFEQQGIDGGPLRDRWRLYREGMRRAPSVPAPARKIEPPAPSPPDGALTAPEAPHLVGRDREWALVSRMWSVACQGRASLLLITGEAGIGKTRLAEDFIASAASGASTARAACYLADRPMAYAAVADWLRSPPLQSVLEGLLLPHLSQLARVMPGILMDRPDVPPPPPVTESWQRAHFFEALARALLAAPAPLLVFIDDVQWCDPETVEWLLYLMRFDPGARMMVLATARTGDFATEHPVAAMLRELRRSERGAEIALGPLSAGDTASLAANMADGRPESSARTLYEKTRGNPLFIVEMVRAGIDESGEDVLPEKVQAVIRTRFSQLSAGARDAASLAAVIGRPFTSSLLAKVAGTDEDSLGAGVDELWQRRLIQNKGAGAYEFAHGLLRDVCYGELAPERCRALHRRVAQVLVSEGAAAESDAASAIIAEHFERGGRAWEAVPHLERAAAVAHHRYAEGESIVFLERALGLLEQAASGGDRDRTELRLLAALAQALMRTRGYGAPEVGRVLARTRALSDVIDDVPRQFAVLSGSILHHVVRADLEVARSIGQECIDLGVRAGDTGIAAGGRFALGCSLFHLGDMAGADEHFADAIAAFELPSSARASHEFGVELGVFVRAYRGHSLWVLGDAGGAQQVSSEAISRAEALSHPFSLAVALAYDAMLQQFRGDPERTWRQADAASAVCQKHGYLYYLSWMPILRGWARARSGSVAEGLAETHEGYASFRATGAELRAPYYLALMAGISLEAGDTDQAMRLVEEGRATALRTGERWQDAELARLKDAVTRARGRR
jgi:DNA-binding SARP family transcriptional activator/predicted ATPase